jgi:ADP-ribosyl-[dinitrogen reductase] hydrolase
MNWFNKKKDLKSKIYRDKIKEADLALDNKNYISKILTRFLIKIKKSQKTQKLKGLSASIDLLKSWAKGDYKEVPRKSLLYLISGILYFLTPIDAIPDVLFFIGFIDDVAVLGLVLNSIKDELEKFKLYKNRMNNLPRGELRSMGSLVGLACGDALGTTIEFEDHPPEKLHTEIIGGGKFRLNAGEWTDDTSMALCLGHSLLEKGFDLSDQLDKYFKWMTLGYMSSNGRCFDIGLGTSKAITKYRNTRNPISEDINSSGNGSIMRLSPISILFNKNGLYDVGKYSSESSLTTHASIEAIESCRYLGIIISNCITFGVENGSKDNILFNSKIMDILKNSDLKLTSKKVISLLDGDWINLKYNELPNSGYVISTMISALWCFYHTNTFEDAVVKAVNLAGDADTIGAVCGQISGAYYGFDRIPKRWRDKIVKLRSIQELSLLLHNNKSNGIIATRIN